MKHSGVRYYTHGYVTLEIGFPEDRVTCANCPLCKYNSAFRTYKCTAQQDKFILWPHDSIDEECPIKFDSEG